MKRLSHKTRLFILILTVLLSVGFLVIKLNRPSNDRASMMYKKGSSPEIDTAIARAIGIYKLRATEGMNFDGGPCLTNDLLPGWVADIVHNPRVPTDDFPENQCAAFREGRAKHFVELDTSGNLIRVL